jgi:hypothetical protein
MMLEVELLCKDYMMLEESLILVLLEGFCERRLNN